MCTTDSLSHLARMPLQDHSSRQRMRQIVQYTLTLESLPTPCHMYQGTQNHHPDWHSPLARWYDSKEWKWVAPCSLYVHRERWWSEVGSQAIPGPGVCAEAAKWQVSASEAIDGIQSFSPKREIFVSQLNRACRMQIFLALIETEQPHPEVANYMSLPSRIMFLQSTHLCGQLAQHSQW